MTIAPDRILAGRTNGATLTRVDAGLVAALCERMIQDPKHINEAITGACVWPPEDGIAALSAECDDKIADLAEASELGIGIAGTRRAELDAARAALTAILNRDHAGG